MEKIEQQMEDDQLGQQMVATPMPNKSKPYTQDSENQKTKVINQHLKPTRYAYHHRLVIHAQITHVQAVYLLYVKKQCSMSISPVW